MDELTVGLYRFAVANPGWTRSSASEALGHTLRDIDTAIESLLNHRLLNSIAASPSAYVAISPDVALADLVDCDERTVLELRGKINARRRELSTLVPAFVEARKRVNNTASVEVLSEPSLIRRVLIEYGRDVSERVLIAQPGQGSTADVHHESIRKDLELLATGVSRKTIYHTSTRDHVPTRKAVQSISAAGGEFRILPHIPLRLMIFDEKLALVGRHLHSGDRAALVIRDPNLIHVFAKLYYDAWDLATPFLDETSKSSPLTSTQQSILNGLASGYSDEVIARRLDISVRTCRRHIAWMLERLGADSRFQAGFKAHNAGWI